MLDPVSQGFPLNSIDVYRGIACTCSVDVSARILHESMDSFMYVVAYLVPGIHVSHADTRGKGRIRMDDVFLGRCCVGIFCSTMTET